MNTKVVNKDPTTQRDSFSELLGQLANTSADVVRDEKENIYQKVDQIGERIKEKLDWCEYVKDSPYWAIGAAAGLGYLASRVFIPRTTPMERIMGSIKNK